MPEQLSKQLEAGLSCISQDMIDSVAVLLPKGSYQAKLITVTPMLMAGQKPPISCQADYYWLGNFEEGVNRGNYEMLLLIVPRAELSETRMDDKADGETTDLAFSMVDKRVVGGQYYQTAVAHFLLDDHHKVMAASQMSRSISVLSFMRLDLGDKTQKAACTVVSNARATTLFHSIVLSKA